MLTGHGIGLQAKESYCFRVSPRERKPRESWGPVFCLRGERRGLDDVTLARRAATVTQKPLMVTNSGDESTGKRKLNDDFNHPFSSDLKRVSCVVTWKGTLVSVPHCAFLRKKHPVKEKTRIPCCVSLHYWNVEVEQIGRCFI